MLERRLTGEPLAWITGTATFGGLTLRVDPGVYVPRWHSELVAERAAQRLARDGVAVDLCTGCGALAAVLRARRPGARVVGVDVDPAAVRCARSNGVEAVEGDLIDALPGELRGRIDVLTGVVPYVPSGELGLLQRDTFAFETTLAYDGGQEGTDVLRRVLDAAPGLLRPGGALVLELGGPQGDALAAELTAGGWGDVAVLRDEDGDVRGIEATSGGR